MLNRITVETALNEYKKSGKVVVINDGVVIKFGEEKVSREGEMAAAKEPGETIL